MTFISVQNIVATILVILIASAPWFVVLRFAFKERQKNRKQYMKRAESFKDRNQQSYEYYLNAAKECSLDYRDALLDICEYFIGIIVIVVSAIAGVLAIIFLICSVCIIQENKRDEIINYKSMQTECNTLTNIIETSNDITNQDIYKKIVKYNKTITELREYSTRDNWKWNFTGNYDWNELPLIKIND